MWKLHTQNDSEMPKQMYPSQTSVLSSEGIVCSAIQESYETSDVEDGLANAMKEGMHWYFDVFFPELYRAIEKPYLFMRKSPYDSSVISLALSRSTMLLQISTRLSVFFFFFFFSPTVTYAILTVYCEVSDCACCVSPRRPTILWSLSSV